MYYTGIGSRQTPDDVLEVMTVIAGNMEREGYVLRSGGAQGADSAFEAGVSDPIMKEIYLPWKGFNDNSSDRYGVESQALKMAEHYHPAWDRCSPAARKFHARNCYQVLGRDLHTPSDLVICWTPGGDVGGTGQALRIARDLDIPVFNMIEMEEPGWTESMYDVIFKQEND